MFQVCDPTGLPPFSAGKKSKTLSTLVNRKVAFVWNQYASTTRFWPELEKAVEALYEPLAVQRIYKENTWSPAQREALDKTLAASDYLVVGVGA
jgi:hypothetical protein